MLSSIVATLLLLQTKPPVTQRAPISAPAQLSRTFAKGEKSVYDVRATLTAEVRPYELDTFMPEDLNVNYKFTTEVIALKPDGIADLRYERPTMTQIEGETYDSPPKTEVTKTNVKQLVTVSPINEILKTVDLTKNTQKKPIKPGSKKTGKGGWIGSAESRVALQPSMNIGVYIQEIRRLALFIGSLDSGLDFNPKLPFDAVKVGDTWKRTVGYSPQKLSGTGKSAVQRLDYVYSYQGLKVTDGKQYQRVQVDLRIDSDVAAFFNELLQLKPSESGLKSATLKLTAQIQFDLDPKTFRTVRADARSTGSVVIERTDHPDKPEYEERIKGYTVMRLVNGS